MRGLWVGRHLFTVLKKKDEQRVPAFLIFFFLPTWNKQISQYILE